MGQFLAHTSWSIKMIIYLYIKKHNKTGLKYLGKTEKDPFKYTGSGKYWKKHLKKHGYDIETTILKECSSNDEIREWGIYYSKLWNIVESNEWANMKPEEGDGNSSETAKKLWENNIYREKKSQLFTGENNPRHKTDIYSFTHEIGTVFVGTMYQFKQNNPEVPTHKVSLLVSGKRKSVKGWRLSKTPIEETGPRSGIKKITDMNEYTFVNENGDTITCTRKFFIQYSGISRSCVNEIVLKQKTRKGWSVKR